MTSPTVDPEVLQIQADAKANSIRMKHVLAKAVPPQTETTWQRWKNGAQPLARNIRAVRTALDAMIAEKNTQIPA